jgi:hypothetical protein
MIKAARMTALGRKLPFNSVAFAVPERPLPGKADIQILVFEKSLRNGRNRLAELLTQARTDFDKDRQSDGKVPHYSVYLDIALVTAAEGNTEETERLIRRWRRGAAEDLAELANVRHHACRVLGMARATTAAVECIRTGLAEPSFVMPFMEPFLPYYDALRDEPQFVELLVDLDDAANDP